MASTDRKSGGARELLQNVTEPLLEEAFAALVGATILQAGWSIPGDIVDLLRNHTTVLTVSPSQLVHRLHPGCVEVVMLDGGPAEMIATIRATRDARAVAIVTLRTARRKLIAAAIDAGARYVFRDPPDTALLLASTAVACETCRQRTTVSNTYAALARAARGFALTLPALLPASATAASIAAVRAIELGLANGLPRREIETLVSNALGDSLDEAADRLAISPASVKRARHSGRLHLGAASDRAALQMIAAVPCSRVPLDARLWPSP